MRSLATTWTSQSSGAGAISANAVAFAEPTVATISAMAAGSNHRRIRGASGIGRVARTVNPTIHPSAAHGNNSSEVRDT